MLTFDVRLSLLLAALAAVAPRPAQAESACRPLAEVRAELAAHGRWTELSSEQFQFARGIFVVNPATPPGLPYGDRAALIQIAGDKRGLILFLDGEMACEPMAAPAELMDLLMRVGAGEIAHEGTAE